MIVGPMPWFFGFSLVSLTGPTLMKSSCCIRAVARRSMATLSLSLFRLYVSCCLQGLKYACLPCYSPDARLAINRDGIAGRRAVKSAWNGQTAGSLMHCSNVGCYPTRSGAHYMCRQVIEHVVGRENLALPFSESWTTFVLHSRAHSWWLQVTWKGA